METEEIAKVFLTVYKNVPRMIDSLERCVDHAIMSGLGCSHVYSGVTTDELYEKIIVFKNRQDILATVKEITTTILKKMKSKNAEVLYLKYVKGNTFSEIAKITDKSIRSVFRNMNSAIAEFCYYLKLMEYDDDTWFRGEKFLEGIYEDVLRQEEYERKKESEKAKERIKSRAKENIYNNYEEKELIITSITGMYLR